MSRKHFLLPVVAVLVFGLMSVFATSAMAHPNSGICSGCHTLSSSVVVKATETANNGATASYSVSVKGPGSASGWAVYSGSSRITYASGGAGTFNVTAGKTYTVFGGNLGSSKLYNSVTISPAASGTPSASGTPDVTNTPVPVPTTTYRRHFNLHGHRYNHLKAVLKNKATGVKYTVAINRKGNAVFRHIPVGSYRLTTTGNKHYKFASRSITIHLPAAEDD
jgi:hypothetical protein